MTLAPEEIARLRSMHDRLDISEVEEIYLPLSRLLSLYVAATRACSKRSRDFSAPKTPRCRTSSASAARWRPASPLRRACCKPCWPAGRMCPRSISSPPSGFRFPNAVLDRERLMEKKGFPESYDLPVLLRFDIKAGLRPVRAPVYSHLIYDVIPNQWIEIDRPDILIVEGLNVLQAGRLPRTARPFPSSPTSSTPRSISTLTRTCC